jgi:hypothetical protein
MTELARDAAIDAAELLAHYSFDLGGFTIERLIDYWLREYPANWLRSALVEALYQGRYKAVSVTQILTLWKRRGQPLYHFNHEFERMVCGKFPRSSITSAELTASTRPSTQTSSLSSGLSAAPLPRSVEVTKLQLFEDAIAVGETSEANVIDRGKESTDARVDDAPSGQSPAQETLRANTSDRPVRALLPAAKSPIEPSRTSPPEAGTLETPPATSKPSATSATHKSVEANREQFPAPPILSASSEVTESPIPTFKPVNAGLDATELVQWAGDRVSKHPIHQFVPSTGVSNFYTKLKAVVQSRDEYFIDLALAGDSISLQEQRERE